jgi:sporulation protein YlmC with PRC-barrel domain
MRTLSYIVGSTALGALLATAPAMAQSTNPADKAPPPMERSMPDAGKSGTTMSPKATMDSSMSMPAGIRTSQLIGTKVYNASNESIGDINDLLLDTSGSVDRVIVGVGGFLGLGERKVALNMSDLDIRKDGSTYRASVSMTKAQLEAMPQWSAPAVR